MLFDKIKNILIKAGQFLKDILPFKESGIPTNSILFKTLTGCGATTLELDWPRNSIIIEPNVPVIIGKKKKHKDILGIYEKTSAYEIAEYLDSDVEHKKIVVTPESFYRVKDAIGESIYTDYFLLIDECERTIQDVDYRPAVILPMFDFFRFKNKAFISATPITPSDPRFKENGFKVYKIKPKFKHRESITLIETNNTLNTIEQFFKNNPRDKYFIFFNSTDNIADIIKRLDIKDETSIYCSAKSAKKLRANKFTSVFTELKNFKKYNFLTSRFFSAVDIDYELHQCDPTIIILTDLVFVSHSMIDPQSEAIQIKGRFRKSDKVDFKKEIVHITNIDTDLRSMTKQEVLDYIKECHAVYRVIKRFYLSVTTKAAKETLKQMLERIDYSRFINKHDKSLNYYMVDNMIFDEKIKKHYMSIDALTNAYKRSNAFIVQTAPKEQYAYTDKERLKNRTSAPLKSLTRIVCDTLKDLHSGKYSDFQVQMEMANLQLDYPEIMVDVNKIGTEEAEKLQYDLFKIKAKLRQRERDNDNFGLMTFIKEEFNSGRKYTSEEIEHILTRGLTQLKITGLAPGLRLLRKFCHLSKERVYIKLDAEGNEIRGYLLIEFWENVN